jgi:hypothetical protein
MPACVILVAITGIATVSMLATHYPETGWRGNGNTALDWDTFPPPTGSRDLLHTFPGVIEPPFLSSSEAPWNDEDQVIGVVVRGQARAYLVSALSRPDRHVINDRIGQIPVSITYCNIDLCARAFTKEGTDSHLDLAVGGQHNFRGLLLLVGNARFYQNSLEPYEPGQPLSRFPYQELPLTVTTWKTWRELHPNTQASGLSPGHGSGRRR